MQRFAFDSFCALFYHFTATASEKIKFKKTSTAYKFILAHQNQRLFDVSLLSYFWWQTDGHCKMEIGLCFLLKYISTQVYK